MNDEQLLRYSRQIMLPEVDIAGQQKLIDATVLIIGMGGLGCPAAMYLAAAGVGELMIADDDEVELTNLQRQIAHSQSTLGVKKVDSASATLGNLNPQCKVHCIASKLAGQELAQAVARADLVLDCTDNFTARFDINRACLLAKKPLVSGAAIRMEGQVAVFNPLDDESPCYQCLYPEGDDSAATCSENGVLAPVVGIIGAMQALEAIKLLCSIGKSLTGRLLLLDASTLQWRELKLRRDAKCPACATNSV